jgi:two-component system cell cycle sensor histidine kinase/response regulator CckA
MLEKQFETPFVIVVADDNPAIVGLVTRVLRMQGHHVLEARGGVEAMDVVESHDGKPLHLLLTDVDMPGMNGIALWQSVRAKRPETKVIFMTGSASADDVGGAPFLSKPFALDKLIGIVEDTLQSSLSCAA